MSFVPCANCGTKPPGKLATLYNAWFDENGVRTCWIQRLCAPCLTSEVAPLLAGASQESSDLTVCPACKTDALTNLSPLYLTVYLPKQEAREFALTMCGSCAEHWRQLLSAGARRAPDRQGGLGAQGSQAPSPWTDVGF